MHFLNNRNFTRLAWFGVLLTLGLLALVIYQTKWLGVALVSVFLVASIAFIVSPIRLPAFHNFAFVLAALLNALGWTLNLYRGMPGFDEFTHAFTTFAATLTIGFLAFYRVRQHFYTHRVHFVIVIVSFGVTLGAWWEIFEYWIIAVRDPVSDLIVDSIGAIAAGLLSCYVLTSSRNERQARDMTDTSREPSR